MTATAVAPLHYLSLADLCRRIKSGELSATHVAAATLARIEALEPRLKAYVRVLGEEAMQTAAALDQRRANGEPLGALHGVPIALKDLLWTQGIATSCGTRVLADWRPPEDAFVVTKLKEAGAVIVGKVKLTEGAYSQHHPDVAPPVNPWSADRWTGVSSSGSGVAVAAGMAYGALGSDTGGSIRFPSACCGLVGIKPTYGRVSRHGAFPLSESLDHIGPMARTVEDAARLLQALAGRDARDATSLHAPVPNYAAALTERLDGLSVGVDWRYVNDGVAPAVVQVVRDALDMLQARGASIVEAQMPRCDDLVAGWAITCGADCALAHAATWPARASDYGPQLNGLLELGSKASATDYARLERARIRFRGALDNALENVSAFIAPCMPMPPPPANRPNQPQPDGEAPFIQFTAPFDYSGHPTITLPLGLDADGVPRACQLIGPRLGEARLIAMGSALEREAGFTSHPTLD